jgi:hypothetical protein
VTEWKPRGDYAIESGAYTISKCFVGVDVVYSAWHKDTLLQTRIKTAEEAKRVCENHNNSNKGE